MQNVVGTTIYLTRGDTFRARVGMKLRGSDEEYIPAANDVIRFVVKRNYSYAQPVITKIIPNDTQMLTLAPADTKTLGFGDYVYDIELTTADGRVDTFIDRGRFIVTEEVD
jgi:hypothetical protein